MIIQHKNTDILFNRYDQYVVGNHLSKILDAIIP